MLNLNNCYLVFALSIDIIGLCLSQYDYSFKENNSYSVLYELNTLDAGRSRSMCGVIVVDAESFQST